MLVYGLKTCDACRKAVKALKAAGEDVRLVDIREEPLEHDQIEHLVDELGPELVNKRSTTWRELDEAARDLPVAALLEAHPTVMKRPVIDTGHALYLGWGAEVEAALT